ncbi:hypothetical protein, partial [Pyrinomonas sp.]|uniref:hypothetical protein n=1 Tax=Pyrinomonas sp. TaxID=2080306 RepID=UPI00332F25D6
MEHFILLDLSLDWDNLFEHFFEFYLMLPVLPRVGSNLLYLDFDSSVFETLDTPFCCTLHPCAAPALPPT